jgi:hypothetical protein
VLARQEEVEGRRGDDDFCVGGEVLACLLRMLISYFHKLRSRSREHGRVGRSGQVGAMWRGWGGIEVTYQRLGPIWRR